MQNPDPMPPAHALEAAFMRPVAVVLTVCQMLMGLGLAIGLIVKIYMLVFTNGQCSPDGQSLGNLLRCTSALELLAQFLIVTAAFRFAAMLFGGPLTRVFGPLMLALCGVLLLLLTGLSQAGVNWQLALVILSLSAAIAAAALARRYLSTLPRA